MKQFDFTYDELLDEIKKLSKEDEGFSIAEMSSSIGKSRRWCEEKVKQLINAGKVKHNGWKKTTRMDGRSCVIPVYIYIK
jgi:Mn-dependent DtxR family transcriptional regulator